MIAETEPSDQNFEILNELKLLCSMYDESSVQFDDPEINFKIENDIPILSSVSCTLILNPDITLCLRLPQNYPKEKLSAHCQISNNAQTSQNLIVNLNNELKIFLKNEGEVSILSVINLVNEKFDTLSSEGFGNTRHVAGLEETPGIGSEKLDIRVCRMWIHSHHIYNEKKRKFIVDNAMKLDLNGFSLPGKPGFICIEGDERNCEDFWSKVRQLTWQKITLVEKEVIVNANNVFHNFEELHLSMSDFMKYLEQRSLSSVIRSYLGFNKN